MYLVLINDYENGKQFEYNRYAEYAHAIEDCIHAAKKFVIDKEGKRYLDTKIFFEPSEVKKRGYFLSKKTFKFGVKITIYYKEPNGVIYSGNVTKIRQYYTAEIKHDGKLKNNYEHIFNNCLKELLKTYNTFILNVKTSPFYITEEELMDSVDELEGNDEIENEWE